MAAILFAMHRAARRLQSMPESAKIEASQADGNRMPETVSWDQVEAALDELLALPESARAESLERMTRGRNALRETLQSLLAYAAGGDDLLDRPALDALTDPRAPTDPRRSASLPPGTRIGAYRVEALIGCGGMGDVYRAQRADGQFEQMVALKLIRIEPGASLARFHAERQILAQLDHPGIARLFDGGVHIDGRPYMVMEYVEGRSLTDWCESRKAPLAERLGLFLQVCAAVAYAHAHLVVHRDLKSTNVVVTADGRAKLLDFGIAKLLHTEAAGDATRTAHFSPAYAAPEQLMGEAITTSTDVYGLGVTLYQLLCGRLPRDVSDLPLAVAVRRLLDEKLVPPSLAVRPGGVIEARELRGDLDAIITKALRKEPRSRYIDARALADDINRHLRREPVLARDGARAYVVGSFLRRHWLPIVALALVFLALVAGIAGTAWQATAARREAQRAEIEAGKATAVKNFLLDIFKQSSLRNPGGAAARRVTAEQLLDIGAERVRSQLRGQIEVRGELLDTLASLYRDLGALDRAVALAQERVDELGRDPQLRTGHAWADAQLPLARALIDGGHDAEAQKALDAAQSALDARGEQDSLTQADVLLQRARAAYDGASTDRAQGIRDLQRALAIVQKRDPDNELHGEILEYFGYYAQLAEDYRGAEIWKKRFLDFERTRDAQSNGFAIGTAYLDLGDVQALAREYAASEVNLKEAVAILTKSAGSDHPSTAGARLRLGEMYYRSGRWEQAEPLLQAALASQQQSPQGQTDATETRKTLGALEFSRGRLGEAERLLRLNLEQLAGNRDLELRYGVSACVLVSVLTAEGELAEAQSLYATASDIYRRYTGEQSIAYAGCALRGAALELAIGGSHADRAAAMYSRVRAAWPPGTGPLPDLYVRATLGLARTDLARGHVEDARAESAELLSLITAAPERQYLPDQDAAAARLLGTSLLRLGRSSDAEAPLRRALELREQIDAPDGIWLAEARISFAEWLLNEGRRSEARRLLERAAVAQSGQPALGRQYREPLALARRRLAQLRDDPSKPLANILHGHIEGGSQPMLDGRTKPQGWRKDFGKCDSTYATAAGVS
jgi:tetratricopeptide (TPR) repeat protein